ncbi:hypothetical protein JQK87_29315 [Streptomyces sp. G44]|uniref:hypothetical protein n=1 Tax=Streptomyces sp. G44 TaxID=2807632 RepID=UPI00196070D2|nr:hypothetical protein [Streptomyces sp. G44]MBM7172421.1 hypothetical protein [Streptomyces sp. G44]
MHPTHRRPAPHRPALRAPALRIPALRIPALRRALLLGAAPLAALAALVALALTACAGPDSLGPGEAVPPVSAQPRPEVVWPGWSGTSPRAPGADAATHQPPPKALKGLPEVGSAGLASLNVHAVLRADPRTRPLADRGLIDRPGRAGLRRPAFLDLTGDKKPEMLVAADTESGRNVLAVYSARGGKVYPVLLTSGRRMSVETIGSDLLVRTPCAEGGEQAVRFHWDGERMSTVSDFRDFRDSGDFRDHRDFRDNRGYRDYGDDGGERKRRGDRDASSSPPSPLSTTSSTRPPGGP